MRKLVWIVLSILTSVWSIVVFIALTAVVVWFTTEIKLIHPVVALVVVVIATVAVQFLAAEIRRDSRKLKFLMRRKAPEVVLWPV